MKIRIPWPPQRSGNRINEVKFRQRSIKTFNKRSQHYDSTLEGRMAGWLKSFLLENIKLKDGDQVLDVACGTGRLLKLLSEKERIICYGIDLSKGMIQAASQNNPEMKFQNADCSRIPSTSGFFDVLTNNAAYHHFTDTEAFAKEAFEPFSIFRSGLSSVIRLKSKNYAKFLVMPPIVDKTAA